MKNGFRYALVALAVGGAVAGWRFAQRPDIPLPKQRVAKAPDCSVKVTKAELEKSIELGTHYMVTHSKPTGNFDYEYDWKAKHTSKDDSAPRQSGALWGLALLHQFAGYDKASPELKNALKRGIAYFDVPSKTTASGARYPIYRGDGNVPTETKGGMGMAALVTLAIIDYVRSLPDSEANEKEKWTKRANEYVAFLAGSLRAEGTWPSDYAYDDGTGIGEHSPYSDGETLLALAEAMKYLGRDDLRPVLERAAVAGHKSNVEDPLAAEPDSATTKGYYQWSSMAYYELATSPLGTSKPAAPYGDWLMALADWILDVHRVGDKPRNTGYAYEGITSAYAWAKAKSDPRAEKFACAIHNGLANLMSWQVGHPRATTLAQGLDDFKAIGGVQNHASEPGLRIDVVQHQMHATMLAEQYLFGR